MEYRIAVGDRIFATVEDKNKAVELAKNCSGVFQDKKCRLITKKWETVKGTPEYVNGKEV